MKMSKKSKNTVNLPHFYYFYKFELQKTFQIICKKINHL